jgi:hypothetical protein
MDVTAFWVRIRPSPPSKVLLRQFLPPFQASQQLHNNNNPDKSTTRHHAGGSTTQRQRVISTPPPDQREGDTHTHTEIERECRLRSSILTVASSQEDVPHTLFIFLFLQLRRAIFSTSITWPPYIFPSPSLMLFDCFKNRRAFPRSSWIRSQRDKNKNHAILNELPQLLSTLLLLVSFLPLSYSSPPPSRLDRIDSAPTTLLQS